MDPYYNQLVGVEEAADQLHLRASFDPYLRAFAALVARFGYEDRYGTRLLHRHYTLGPGEAVMERCVVADGEHVLRSAVEPVGSASVPASTFAWVHRTLLPLEFSEDPALRTMPPADSTFVDSWGDLVSTCGLDDLLGLTCLPRRHLVPDESQTYVETSDAVASTVKLESREGHVDGDVTTVWTVEPTAVCRPGNYCRGWSTCRREGSPPDDRHSQSYGHDAGRGPHTTT